MVQRVPAPGFGTDVEDYGDPVKYQAVVCRERHEHLVDRYDYDCDGLDPQASEDGQRVFCGNCRLVLYDREKAGGDDGG